MSVSPPGPTIEPPTGYKLLAWEGIGLWVPQRWDLGRHQGSELRGSFRVDDEHRIVLQVRWWPAQGQVSFDRVLAQHAASRAAGQAAAPFRRLTGLPLPAGDGDRCEAFTSVPENDPTANGDVLVVWQQQVPARVSVWRVLCTQGFPRRRCLEQLSSGLRSADLANPRAFAAHDFALCAPAGFLLRKDVLSVGVCYLRFQRGRDWLACRRFSAADAIMGTAHPTVADLEAWCGRVYAGEFHDLRYTVAPRADPRGRTVLCLRGQSRLLAPIELRWLIPKHRRPPRGIDVVWDAAANKIYCLEFSRLKPELEQLVATFGESVRFTLASAGRQSPADASPPAPALADREPRLRALAATVSRTERGDTAVNAQGRAVITHTLTRPRHLRWLRLLAGLEAGDERVAKHVELDLIGSLVWDHCDGTQRVADLVELVRERFRISYREAELAVTDFVRNLGARGLLAVALPPADRK